MTLPTVNGFAGLIRWLLESQHSGNVSDLARRIGVSQAAASKWKHDDNIAPTLETLAKIAAAYQIDFYEVIAAVAPARPFVSRVREAGAKSNNAPARATRHRESAPAPAHPLPAARRAKRRSIMSSPSGHARERWCAERVAPHAAA